MSSWGRRLSEDKQLELEHALPKAVVRRLYGNDYRQDACYHWFDEESEDTIEEYPLLLVGYLNGLLALIIVLVAMILAWVYLCTGNPCCAGSCCRCWGRCLAITATTWCVIALVLWEIGLAGMVDDMTSRFDENPYDVAAGPFLMVIGAICVLLTTVLETKLMGPPVATPATTTVQIMPAAQVHSGAP